MTMDRHRNPDGTYNGIGVLSELTGLPRSEVQSLAAQVKANQARLGACAWHEFELIDREYESSWQGQRYRCRHCGGEIDSHAHYWHEQGRRVRP